MGLSRFGSGLARSILGLPASLPLAALVVAAIVDRGPNGSLRLSAFPAALVLFDPMTWECLRHSATVAGIVALASFVLGVPMARMLVRWTYWGRPVLTMLVTAPVAVPPLIGALGLRGWFDPGLPSPFLDPEASALRPWTWGVGAAWGCWIWVGTSLGVGWVARSVGNALERVDPEWERAGLATGASPWRVWRSITWPLVRPNALRSAAIVFGVVLLEPGVPLILRLRSTLSYQIVEALSIDGVNTRAAWHVLLGVGSALIVLLVTTFLAGSPVLDRDGPPLVKPRRACWWRATLFLAGLTAWLVVSWFPWLSLVITRRHVIRIGSVDSIRTILGILRGSDIQHALIHSGVIGLLVGTLTLLAAHAAHPGDSPSRGMTRLRHLGRRALRACRFASLVVGIGVLACPSLIRACSSWLVSRWSSAGGIGGAFESLAGWLEPTRFPGLGLVLALSLVHASRVTEAVRNARRHRLSVMEECARGLGSSPWRAWWDVSRPYTVPPILGAWLLTITLAATDVGASVVLSPTGSCRPIGPTLLDLADAPGGVKEARVLAGLTLVICILVHCLATWWTRGRGSPPRGG